MKSPCETCKLKGCGAFREGCLDRKSYMTTMAAEKEVERLARKKEHDLNVVERVRAKRERFKL